MIKELLSQEVPADFTAADLEDLATGILGLDDEKTFTGKCSGSCNGGSGGGNGGTCGGCSGSGNGSCGGCGGGSGRG